jgi:hypothetical protein
MGGLSKVRDVLTHPIVVVAGAACLVAATGCAGAVDSQTQQEAGGDPPSVAAETSDAFTSGVGDLFWVGAAQNHPVGSSRPNDVGAIVAVDIGITNFCGGFLDPRCRPAITGLQVWTWSPITQSTYPTSIGKVLADNWTREQCPNGGVVAGYDVGVGKNTGSTRIERLGFECINMATNVANNLTILGKSDKVLFTQQITCKLFSTSPMKFAWQLWMNPNGDGMSGNCAQP